MLCGVGVERTALSIRYALATWRFLFLCISLFDAYMLCSSSLFSLTHTSCEPGWCVSPGGGGNIFSRGGSIPFTDGYNFGCSIWPPSSSHPFWVLSPASRFGVFCRIRMSILIDLLLAACFAYLSCLNVGLMPVGGGRLACNIALWCYSCSTRRSQCSVCGAGCPLRQEGSHGAEG